MSTIIDNLVTDRTQADVERVKALAVKGYAGMTAALEPWQAGTSYAKGAAFVTTARCILRGRR